MVTVKLGRPSVPYTGDDAARKTKIETIFRHYASNLSSPITVQVALDAMKIRGGFDQTSYTGYDYAAQRWVEVEF